MVYEMCRKFADEELAPNAGQWDRNHEFPKEAVTKLVRIYVDVEQCLLSSSQSCRRRRTLHSPCWLF